MSQWLVLLCTLSLVSSLGAQTTSNPRAAQSDPKALVIVHKAVETMGGATRWQSIGGALVQVVETIPGGRTVTVQWSDDWHSGRSRWRREATGPDGQPIIRMADENSNTRTSAGKTLKLPHEEDITVLAVAYPAAALMLSLNRKDCVLALVPTSSSAETNDRKEKSDPIVAAECHPLDSKGGEVRIYWQFSATTGMPLRVRLPTPGYFHNSLLYEIARFDAFSRTGNVTVPSTVGITLPSGRSETLTLSGWSFASSLPASTFAAKAVSHP
jgi:hypothetical protein